MFCHWASDDRVANRVALAAANKRVSNILSKQQHDGSTSVDTGLLQAEAETTLSTALEQCHQSVRPLLDAARYAEALDVLAQLRGPVDAFFDDVMVMAEDEAVRRNRLALLASLQSLFLEVADIAQLQQ